MATRIERMEESLANYKAKIIEIEGKIKDEKEALIGKRADAEKKLQEAKDKFDAMYKDIPLAPVGNEVEIPLGEPVADVLPPVDAPVVEAPAANALFNK